MRRRFFEHFEQRVGAVRVQFVDGIDDGDAPAAHRRGRAEKRDGAPHLVDRNFARRLLIVLARDPPQHDEVGMRERRDLAVCPTIGGDLKAFRPLLRLREQKTREAIGERRLAYAFRTAEEKRMRHAAAVPGRQYLGFYIGVAEEFHLLAGMRAACEPVAFFALAHPAARGACPSRSGRNRRSCTTIQMRTATTSGLWLASMSRQRSGSPSAISR